MSARTWTRLSFRNSYRDARRRGASPAVATVRGLRAAVTGFRNPRFSVIHGTPKPHFPEAA